MAKKDQPSDRSLISTGEQEALKRLYDVMMPAGRKHGKLLSAGGAVRELYRGGVKGFGAKVLDGSVFEVSIVPDEDEWFEAACTCSIAVDCKHVAAVLDVLLDSSPGRTLKFTDVPTHIRERTPLTKRLAELHGRTLTPKENHYVRRVLEAHARYSSTGYFFGAAELVDKAASEAAAGDLVLPPRGCDGEEFWSYLAYQLRERGIDLPEFMRVVEHSEETGTALRAILRQRQVEAWETYISRGAEAAPTVLDCRICLTAEGVQLEQRFDSSVIYSRAKRTQIRQWMTEYEEGKLTPAPGCEGVFMVFREDWVTRTGYAKGSGALAASLLAAGREADGRSRIVNEKGEPYEWSTEPLRWALKEAEDEHGNHVVELSKPDGSSLGTTLLVVAGMPSVYVTSAVIYQGPRTVDGAPAAGGGSRSKVSNATRIEIPASAVASTAGIRFLSRMGAPMPLSLSKRIKRIPLSLHMHITTTTDMYKPENGEAEIQVSAVDPDGDPCLRWTGLRWASQWHDAARNEKDEAVVEVQDESKLPDIPTLMAPLGGRWPANEEILRIRMTKGFPDRFGMWLQGLPKDVTVDLPDELASFREGPIRASIKLDCANVKDSPDWFDLRVIVNVDDTQLTQEELRALLDAKGRFVNLKGKGWRRLAFDVSTQDEEQLADLGLSVEEFSGEPQRLHALQLSDASAHRFLSHEQVQRVERRVADLKLEVAPAVPAAIKAELRHYQVQGFHFLAYLAENSFGGILADDMGLGKTLQALTWLVWLRERRKQKGTMGPSLVICPKSVTDNWAGEAARFAPGLKVRIWRGSDVDGFTAAAKEHDLLVLNYAQLRGLSDAIIAQRWLAVLLDEGQYIKNPESQTARVAASVEADHRLVLTGTPIENRLLDLWSLMGFAMPGALGNRANFTKNFDKSVDPLARRRLAARVRPFLLRRTKSEVAPELPPRTEEDLICEMTDEQAVLYRAELKRAQQMLLKIQSKKQFDKERFNFLTSLLRLRQISCDPGLLGKQGSGVEGAKVEALTDLLEPLMEEGHKVLVFSQFVSMIERLTPVLAERNWKHFVLTGQTEERGDLVREFQAHEGAAVFMISLKAGGFGLNLTSASYVVLFDPWWNPAVESQAIDRTHRIGQTRHVMAYRLIMKGTIEEKIRKLQHSKSALATDVLGEEGFAKALTVDDLRFLLSE